MKDPTYRGYKITTQSQNYAWIYKWYWTVDYYWGNGTHLCVGHGYTRTEEQAKAKAELYARADASYRAADEAKRKAERAAKGSEYAYDPYFRNDPTDPTRPW